MLAGYLPRKSRLAVRINETVSKPRGRAANFGWSLPPGGLFDDQQSRLKSRRIHGTYKVDWFVMVASKVPCMVEIAFNDPALSAQAKLVANSLKPGI
jgi:hypothetical protein